MIASGFLAAVCEGNQETEPCITFLKALSLVLNTSGFLAAVCEGNQGTEPCVTFWRHWAWHWIHLGSWQQSGRGTEPWTHLLEGIVLGIEHIWVPGSSLEGELNPGLTFLKALSLVLNTSGSLAAVWKGNWGLRALLNSPPISDKKRLIYCQFKCVLVPYEINKNIIFLPGWTRPRASNFFNFSAFSRLTL